MKFSNPNFISLSIVLGGALLFLPFIGSVHLFDWDEVNFAECAREMLVSGNYLTVTIDYLPFSEKPPLFIWMQVLSMKIFGVNEFAARFPNALCGIATLLVVFHTGKRINGTRLGLLWVLAFAGSFLPHFYFMSGIIDPWFNLFIFLGIYFFVLFTFPDGIPVYRESRLCLFLSALFIGLAVLTKGPVAFLVFLLCGLVYWAYIRFRKVLSLSQLLVFSLTLFAVGGSWYIFQLFRGGGLPFESLAYHLRLLNGEDAGHEGPVYYHVLVLLFGCFPASVIALAAFRKDASDAPFQAHFKLWMFILFFVVLVLFSLVRTKIVHYSSLCYFPLTFFAAYSIDKWMKGEWKWNPWIGRTAAVIGTAMGVIFVAPVFLGLYAEEVLASGMIRDAFAAENLKAVIYWSGFEVLPGTFFIGGIILIGILLKRRNAMAFPSLCVLSMVALSAVSVFIVPKVEQYTQGAPIEFYKRLQDKPCYVETLGFKSYAHLFYSRKHPDDRSICDTKCLLSRSTDKPVFFVSKMDRAQEYKQTYPQLRELYRKNGFVFYKKEENTYYFSLR